MKQVRKKGWLIVAATVLMLLVQSSFRTSNAEEEMRTIILQQAARFTGQVQALNQLAQALAQGKITMDAFKQQLAATRSAYKGIEYIVEYYYPEHVKEYLNGPPLYHLDPYPFDSSSYYGVSASAYLNTQPLDYLERDHFLGKSAVIAPRGLQVLDEGVFSGELTDPKELLKLTTELETKWMVVSEALNKRKYFQSFEITEAARLQLIRIFTLGITGFDTPGSLNIIDETKAAINALQQVMAPLLHQTAGILSQQATRTFDNTNRFLAKQKDFDSFDRLAFLTNSLNPLYKVLLDIHRQQGLTTTQQLSGKVASWNFYSDNIFAANFLDPYYFSLLKKDKDNDGLRALGKRLFYDTRLSNNGKMSCGTCHKPELAFTDGIAKSYAAIEGRTVLRNAPSLINAVYADRYFYDLRSFDLEDQTGQVIKNHEEFDTDFPELLKKLQADSAYVKAFALAAETKRQTGITLPGASGSQQAAIQSGAQTGKTQPSATSVITRYRISSALASYIISLRSFNSPFDQYVRGERKTLSPKVKQGFNLFMGKANCGTCHYPPLFSGLVPPAFRESESEVLGILDKPGSNKVDADMGRAGNKVLNEQAGIYQHAFKTMTVRNAAFTAPYFHNGAYKTLQEVIDFYNNGGAQGVGLTASLPNQTLAADSLHLSLPEQEAILSFLQSLTDSSVIRQFRNH